MTQKNELKCAKCPKTATTAIPYGERNYCDKHFLEFIEKRIRKDLRKSKPNIKQEQILLNDDSTEYHITKYFLKEIYNDRLKFKESKDEPECTIMPRTIGEETTQFLEQFLSDKDMPVSRAINPLKHITPNELKELCRILKIKYQKKENNEILENLENSYPGTMFSAMKTKEFLEQEKNKKNKKM